MLNLIVICCLTPVMMRIHTFLRRFRTLFFFPLHDYSFAERESRGQLVLSNIPSKVASITSWASQCWIEQALEP